MASYIGRILVAQGYVDRTIQATALLRRRNQRRAVAEHRAERAAELGMENGRRMLELASLAHDRRFAVTLDLKGILGDCSQGLSCQQVAQLLADVDQLREVLAIHAR